MKKFEESNMVVKEKYFSTKNILFDESFEKYKHNQKECDQNEQNIQDYIMNMFSPKVIEKEIDTIRDCAILLESTDSRKANDLMLLAHKLRPNGLFISQKLKTYKTIMEIRE